MMIETYKVNRKHRVKKATEKASIWTVSEWTEIALFANAGANQWKTMDDNVLWSFLPEPKIPGKIGLDPKNTLYFAKFVCDHNHEWHGYPIHPRGADIPPENVLEKWRQASFIDKVDKKRIKAGGFR